MSVLDLHQPTVTITVRGSCDHSHFQGRKRGSERLRDLLKVTQVRGNGAGSSCSPAHPRRLCEVHKKTVWVGGYIVWSAVPRKDLVGNGVSYLLL